jgi:hypothetical protein
MKPSGIRSVKIDPETGLLAGPNCPNAQTVSVAFQFAPWAECLKHRPELEDAVEIEDLAKQNVVNTPPPSEDSEPVELDQSEPAAESNSATEPYENSQLAGESQSAVRPKSHSQPTQKEVNQNGRASLVSVPVFVNDRGVTTGKAP